MTATILSGEQFLTLDYSFDSACDLTGARFFEYVDLDILFAFDDEFSFIGSIGGGDLVLIQNDIPPPVVGPVVSRVGGALLSGFGSDGFFSLGGNILAGGFDLPPGGDIGLNFGDTLSANVRETRSTQRIRVGRSRENEHVGTARENGREW